MTKFVYIGGVDSSGEKMPVMTSAFKLDFELNKPVDVTDPNAIQRLQNNKFFRLATEADEPKPVVKPGPKPGFKSPPPAQMPESHSHTSDE